MIRKIITLMCSLTLLTGVVGCTKQDKEEESGKIKIMVSINPLKEFAQAVGKELVEVDTLVPEGMEPHDFEPKSKDLVQLNKSDIFVYNGLGMEEWLDKVLSTIQDKDRIKIVDSSKGASTITTEGKIDPHLWLSLKQAKNQAANIKDALIKIDEKNKEQYEGNFNEFASRLDTLYYENEQRFNKLKNRDFVTGHEAFGYLCRDFNLTQKSVEDVFAEGEVTPQKFKDLVQFSKENKIETIFMEEFASPKVSETLAKEVGAKVEKIYTIESKEDGRDYVESMKYNLDVVYNSLK
ncbi:ABC transporter substrate-binding protein [Clostridium polyendosporum]|uniref:ABC transporter substrate-binding protein n=1 Tax=Clostridium polyendosporum TaxID=69208 RepID=A0A919S235_9CLOT|nr:zinc ABC transporter substrate-binding protein [Clostridium polyendosporum]GIM29183.1 ABC transporter substrate-binding protein [Clostridium polyendosporum]